MPNHRIILDVERIDRQAYDEAMDQLFLLHHVHPTNLIHMSQTDADLVAQGEADSYARGAKKPQGRNGKKVHYQSDPDYCNGLPRRKK